MITKPPVEAAVRSLMKLAQEGTKANQLLLLLVVKGAIDPLYRAQALHLTQQYTKLLAESGDAFATLIADMAITNAAGGEDGTKKGTDC